MNAKWLNEILSSLTGCLAVADAKEKQALQQVQQVLADVLEQQDPSLLRNREFSFERVDWSCDPDIPKERQTAINGAMRRGLGGRTVRPANLKVFLRDVPVRTSQIPGSIPAWAAGARLAETVGPFRNQDGRQIWFDYYRVVRESVTIHIQGQTAPALLFTGSFTIKGPAGKPHPGPKPARDYPIAAGSVWVNARLLCQNAPADHYCGLRVKSGTVHLDAAPQIQNNQLVITPSHHVSVQLVLEQREVAGVATDGPYGVDARNTQYQLPLNFFFDFQGTNHTYREIGAATWKLYGQTINFAWTGSQNAVYGNLLNRVLIPLQCNSAVFTVTDCQSPFNTISGKADIKQAFWSLPAALLDVNHPLEAAGSGALVIHCGRGLRSRWQSLEGNNVVLNNPQFIGDPERICIGDLAAKSLGARQQFELWRDDLNPHGASVELIGLKTAPYIYISAVDGNEGLITRCNAAFLSDRPVKANGEPVTVKSKNSWLVMGAGNQKQLIYIYDDNLLWDNKLPSEKIPVVSPMALALDNALFTVSPPNGCLLFGTVDAKWRHIVSGNLFLVFGMFSYLPILPDPYAVNLKQLRQQFAGRGADADSGKRVIWLWLVSRVRYRPVASEKDEVDVSFHFGNFPAGQAVNTMSNIRTAGVKPAAAAALSDSQKFAMAMLAPEQTRLEPTIKTASEESGQSQKMSSSAGKVPDYGGEWKDRFGLLDQDAFALLDVSGNAGQFGVSFALWGRRLAAMVTTAVATDTHMEMDFTINNAFPFIVDGLEVKSPGHNVHAFTLPQIAWEPVFNLSSPGNAVPMDPKLFWNYYPNDGGPTKIFSSSGEYVALAPRPLLTFILNEFLHGKNNATYASFTLPFGLKAIAQISKHGPETVKPQLALEQPEFHGELQGGIQIRATAGNHGKQFPGQPSQNDGNMFPGYTVQLNNILSMLGSPNGTSTLGDSVTRIFNNEFLQAPLAQNVPGGRGVPVERIDFSGYGASIFSNWLSPSAEFAQTSQSRFDVLLGRTVQEVIQVKSILYPWGIRVVRTITLFRTGSGYVYRVDSGWQAEADGKFDFRYTYLDRNNVEVPKTPYQIHPGVVKGLFNVGNIKEDGNIAVFETNNTVAAGEWFIDVTGHEVQNSGAPFQEQVMCRGVWFDADVEIEGVTQGYVACNNGGSTKKLVASQKILGYVQLAPAGKPLTALQFNQLLQLQGGSIGGALDCLAEINQSKQQIRISRFDMNNSVDQSGNPIFTAAARGSMFLPKEGSWSVVQHHVGSGEVTPLPENVTVPLIRIGEWLPDQVIPASSVSNQLIRVANPLELLRSPGPNTVNYGFLQSTATQKALFLTPAFANGCAKLLSKTPPLFADAYRLMTGNGIFPNIGDAATNYGKAMAMRNGIDANHNAVTAFGANALEDGGEKVLELLEIQAQNVAGAVARQGLSLLQRGANGLVDKALQFDIPSFAIPLVDLDALKIYIEYKTGKKGAPASSYVDGKLDFDVDSFAADVAKSWKSRLNNVAMVVDLGAMKRLMVIKGNFDARKGKESAYEGANGLGGLPTPEIEFSDALQPVIDILELLAKLSTGEYAATMQKGLKIAMGNSGEIWDYKFEAGMEIPLVKFPSEPAYSAPQTPLKLEASLGLGVYFNAALKVTGDAAQLLPTAGAYLKFHGGLSVMCTSIGAASVYALGSVALAIGCDTKTGPSLGMKFGFGAQVVVGLPVVGKASLLFMVGIEINADSSHILVAAMMLFRGHAELLGGLVGVTITIEAKGTVERLSGSNETNCIATVTFGLDISIFLVIDISFSESWSEKRQIA